MKDTFNAKIQIKFWGVLYPHCPNWWSKNFIF